MENATDILTWVRERLEAARDESYAQFMRTLMPTVDETRIIGVRTPELRRIAKEAARRDDVGELLACLPHPTFEEAQVHSFVISGMRDYDLVVNELARFLPYADNWATCDQLSPKVLAKRPEQTLALAHSWIASPHAYTTRFGILTLMRHFLDERFFAGLLDEVVGISSEEYYVNMMRAWFFAEALARQWEATIPYLQKRRLDRWTHNKAIQKAIESRRISAAEKELLRSLRWPGRA